MSKPRLHNDIASGRRQAAPHPLLAWVLGALLVVPLPLAAAKLFYRYTNDKGVVAIDDHVPPEFVKNGYQVLTPDGRVVETIPRQLSGDEGKRQRAAAAEAARLQAWDESLLRRYSSLVDIESARDRAVRDYTVRISILRSNLLGLKSQIEREQATAADYERGGRSVPASLTETIAALRAEVADTEQAIVQREAEVAELKASYERDMARFAQLKDIVEWRRRRQAVEEE